MIGSGGDAALDEDGSLLGHAGVLMLMPESRKIDPWYLLGVLNSRVFWFFVCQMMPTMGEGRRVLRREALRRFPLVVTEGTHEERSQIAALAQAIRAANSEDCPAFLARMDRLVSRLYGLEPEELPPIQRNPCA